MQIETRHLSSIDRNHLEAYLNLYPGIEHRQLACLAAFPVVLTPDLLYKLWLNFRSNESRVENLNHQIVVSDILQSPICREIGDNLYKMHFDIRFTLLKTLQREPGFENSFFFQLAEFLRDYLRFNPEKIPNARFFEAQYWLAESYLDPQKAARVILELLQQEEHDPDAINHTDYFLRLTKQRSLFNRSKEIGKSSTDPLLVAEQIVQGFREYRSGNIEKAVKNFEAIRPLIEDIRGEGKGFRIRIPTSVWTVLSPTHSATSLQYKTNYLIEKFSLEEKSLFNPKSPIDLESKNYYSINENGQLTRLSILGQNMTDEDFRDVLMNEDLSQLLLLDLRENRLTEIEIFSNALELRHINVNNNPSLRSFHFEKELPHLETLNARDCAIESFNVPPGCNRLRILNLYNNALKSITFASDCPRLENLDLGRNQLTEIALPQGFNLLSNVNLSENQLQYVRIQSSLPQLKVLNLGNNQLIELPENVILNKEYGTLYLYNNPLPNIPREIIHQEEEGNSFETVLAYLKTTLKAVLINDRVSIIILGNGRVGKTSLYRRLKNEPFNQNESYTHGIHLGVLTKEHLPLVKTETLHADIWDFGGQEIFYATHQFFLRDDALYLLAWTDERNVLPYRGQSPIEETWHSIEYWLEHIRMRSKDSPIVMVQTHSDGVRSEVKSEYQQAPYFASCINFSASDDLGLTELRYLIAQKLNSNIRNFGQIVPRTYNRVITLIEAKRRTTPTISTSEFVSLCREASINVGGENSLLYYLHRTGVVVYFGGPDRIQGATPRDSESSLKNTIYIDPNWLTKQVYRVINNQLQERAGQIDATYLKETLPDYTSEEVAQLWNSFNDLDLSSE